MAEQAQRSEATVGLTGVRTLRETQLGALYAGQDANRNQAVWVKDVAPKLDPALVERAREAFEREIRAVFRSELPALVKPLETELRKGGGYVVFPAPEARKLTPLGVGVSDLASEDAASLLGAVCEVLAELAGEGLTFAVLPVPYLFRHQDGSLAWMPATFHYLQEQLGIAPAVTTQEPLLVAPEIREGRADERSLVYSVAAWGYLLLAGPENRGSLESIAAGTRPRPLYMINAGVPPDYAQALERGLRPDPRDRYQTFGEFAAALARAPRPQTVEAGPQSRFGQLWAAGPLSWIPLPVAIVLAILGLVFAGFRLYPLARDSFGAPPDPTKNEIYSAPSGTFTPDDAPKRRLEDDLLKGPSGAQR